MYLDKMLPSFHISDTPVWTYRDEPDGDRFFCQPDISFLLQDLKLVWYLLAVELVDDHPLNFWIDILSFLLLSLVLFFPQNEIDIFSKLSWQAPIRFYVNGGVLFFKNNNETKYFFEFWHKSWLYYYIKICAYNDQPSLNYALNESSIKFNYLQNQFNAQVNARPRMAWGGIIWHFYSSTKYKAPKNIFDWVSILNNPMFIPFYWYDVRYRKFK